MRNIRVFFIVALLPLLAFAGQETPEWLRQAKKLYETGEYARCGKILKANWSPRNQKTILAVFMSPDPLKTREDAEKLLRETNGLLACPELPPALRIAVLQARAVPGYRSLRSDWENARREAEELIQAKSDLGYYVLIASERAKNPSHPDYAKILSLAMACQASRGFKVDYLYQELGDSAFALKDWKGALAFYLHAWTLMSPKNYPDRVKQIERRVGECLEKLEAPNKADAWKKWLAETPENRDVCPALGVGQYPAAWNAIVDQALAARDTETFEGALNYALSLFHLGRFAEADAVFSRLETIDPAIWERRDLSQQIEAEKSATRKFGKMPPAALP